MVQIKIGLLGEMRAGKDTVAEIIVEELGQRNTDLYAFSSGIHDVIKRYLPGEYDKGKPREALQRIGQLFREFDPDVWVNNLLLSADLVVSEITNSNVIVTDVRQPNEAKRLKEEGYTIIKVTADTDVRTARAAKAGDNFSAEMLTHETEQLVNECEFDVEINNSGTLEDLRGRVIDVLTELQKG